MSTGCSVGGCFIKVPQLGLLKAAMSRTMALVQLVEGFELEPSETELR
jgi:hypothetical protein